MENDCYLFLLRWTGDVPKTPLGIAAQIPKLLLSFVRGDSLEVPFMNFIRVNSIEHGISSGTGEYKGRSWMGDQTKAKGKWYQGGQGENLWSGITGKEFRPTPEFNKYTGSVSEPGSMKHQPTQGTLKFTKHLDSATPQLAYGCSVQEQYKFAIFYFRRKVALNVSAVQFPYLMIGLEDVMISDWNLDGDSEAVDLNYNRICWAGVSQLADTSVPQGVSVRIFDRTTGTGSIETSGKHPEFPLFLTGFTGAMYTAAWLSVAAASKG